MGTDREERLLAQRAGLRRVDIARDHEHHVPRVIIAGEVGHEVGPGGLPDGVVVPDHGTAIGVDAERLLKHRLPVHPPRVVLVHPQLLEAHLFLPGQFLLVEHRVSEGVGQDIQGVLQVPARDRDVIDRLVETRVGVDLAPEGFHFPRDLAGAPPLRPLEGHVFEDVGHPRALLGLGRAPRLDPDLHGDDRGGVVLPDHDGQAVSQREFPDHLRPPAPRFSVRISERRRAGDSRAAARRPREENRKDRPVPHTNHRSSPSWRFPPEASLTQMTVARIWFRLGQERPLYIKSPGPTGCPARGFRLSYAKKRPQAGEKGDAPWNGNERRRRGGSPPAGPRGREWPEGGGGRGGVRARAGSAPRRGEGTNRHFSPSSGSTPPSIPPPPPPSFSLSPGWTTPRGNVSRGGSSERKTVSCDPSRPSTWCSGGRSGSRRPWTGSCGKGAAGKETRTRPF